MQSPGNGLYEMNRHKSFFERLSALSCIRFLVVWDCIFQLLKISISLTILFITRKISGGENLRIFIYGYIILCLAKGITFYYKNRSFFRITRIPDFEDNSDLAIFTNLTEGCSLFWYIIGFHWIQECTDCAVNNRLLYYTSMAWLLLGFITFVAPLLAIVFLLIIVTYIKPKLQIINYRSEQDIPDGNTRCIICYEHYHEGNNIKFLPCDHHFHQECIDEWFNVRDCCPLCKKSINILYDLIEAENAV